MGINVDKEIETVREQIKKTTSHLGRIELEKKLADLLAMKKDRAGKASWEM